MPPSGIRYVGNSTAGVSLTIPYNSKTFLPNLGDAHLRPRALIDGVLQVEFPRQVRNSSVTIGFHDELGNAYVVGCLGCGLLP